MKKLSTIIMALALVLGMSQCKKQETPTTGNTTPTNPGVHITVNVGDKDGKDNNGERHNIAPDYGLFAFTQGDVLYVGHNGKYVGMLTFNGACFDGTIYPDDNVTDQPLHFYFLGGKGPQNPALNETAFSISIADQSGNLPVLSYGPSEQTYPAENTSYSATLKNKCALVKLSLVNPTTETVTLSGVPTMATVNFANPTNAIEATDLEDLNDITLRYVTTWNPNLRWVILLPGTDLTDVVTVAEGVEPVMANNTHITSGLTLNNPAPVPDPPAAAYAVKKSDGTTLTQFSVSANKKVYFSIGNLKADFTSGGYAEGWSFHATQFGEVAGPTMNLDNPNDKYYYVHQQSGSNTNNPAAPNGIIFINHQNYGDRFTWGYFSSITLATKEYVHSEEDLSKTAAVAKDWGCVFTESSPEGGNWRTLSANEWIYLFNGATTGTSSTVRGDKRFLRVRLKNFNINPINASWNEEYWGVFVFPDNYQGSNLTGTYTFNSDTYTEIDYSNADVARMLNDGAVFLPCVGYRYDDRYYDYICYRGETIGAGIGYYWSSTHIDGTTNYSKGLKFVVRGGGTNSTTGVSIVDLPRNYGYCVRLVWDAN